MAIIGYVYACHPTSWIPGSPPLNALKNSSTAYLVERIQDIPSKVAELSICSLGKNLPERDEIGK